MALVICSYCQQELDDSEKQCPRCKKVTDHGVFTRVMYTFVAIGSLLVFGSLIVILLML